MEGNMYKMNRLSLSVVLFMVFFAHGCLEFASVTQPGTAESFETFRVPITINITQNQGDVYYPTLAIKLPNNWSVMDSIEFTGDYSGALAPDPFVRTLFEAFRPSGPDHTWWGSSSGLRFDPVVGTSASGTANIIINDTTGTFSIDYFVMGLASLGDTVGGTFGREIYFEGCSGECRDPGNSGGRGDSSMAHSITVSGITTAVQETTWGALKSRR